MSGNSGAKNRLSGETSPYLQQHAGNPVDWYPWGPEALEKARREDRPIFLSIGYSACHWCHVMERESFEDPEVARILSEGFVSIKVDREERPDLDDIYMTAVQAMTGHGGWPMTVFLTPDLHPFYGGTYFPPGDRWGRPGFKTVLHRVREIFVGQRARVDAQGRELTALVQRHVEVPSSGATPELDEGILTASVEKKMRSFDPLHGGFGSAPKFPPSFGLEALARALWRRPDPRWREALDLTLDRMAAGGMYDQLGGGFARYSTDERWLVPHFEKMLYDNALLVPVYLEADRLLGRPGYRKVVDETLTWLAREMTDPAGGFWSSQDADSEGVEGKFFVWTPEEVAAVLGPEDAALAGEVYGITAGGNWHEMPGKTVLHVASVARASEAGSRLDSIRSRLFEARRARVPPGTDTKILAAWNGLMIRALAQAGAALEDPRRIEAARRAAGFCLGELRDPQGLLLRTWRQGRAHLNAYQEDYAYLVEALVALFDATSEPRWLEEASGLADSMIERFLDREAGGFFFTSHDHEALIVRTKNPMDNATPSGNSSGARALLRLAHLRDEPRYREVATGVLRAFAAGMRRLPEGFMNMVVAADMASLPPSEVVVAGPASDPRVAELLRIAREWRHPDTPVIAHDPDGPEAELRERLVPACRDKRPPAGEVVAFVCSGGTCRRPVATGEELRRELEASWPAGLRRPPRG